MYQVVVASTNPAKIKAVNDAFSRRATAVKVTGIEVDSGVAAQPMSDEETKRGALQRLQQARQQMPAADYWVAIEAGIDGSQAFAWVIIESQKARGESRSASFQLPERVYHALLEGQELGDVMAEISGINQIKHKTGAIGVLTDGLLDRSAVYQQALLLALAPLHHPCYCASPVESASNC